MSIEKNINGSQRAVRIIAGTVLISLVSLAFTGPETYWAFLGIIGLLPLTAGITGRCFFKSCPTGSN